MRYLKYVHRNNLRRRLSNTGKLFHIWLNWRCIQLLRSLSPHWSSALLLTNMYNYPFCMKVKTKYTHRYVGSFKLWLTLIWWNTFAMDLPNDIAYVVSNSVLRDRRLLGQEINGSCWPSFWGRLKKLKNQLWWWNRLLRRNVTKYRL